MEYYLGEHLEIQEIKIRRLYNELIELNPSDDDKATFGGDVAMRNSIVRSIKKVQHEGGNCDGLNQMLGEISDMCIARMEHYIAAHGE